MTMNLGNNVTSTVYHSMDVDFPMSVIVRLSGFKDYTLGVQLIRHTATTWSNLFGTHRFTSDVTAFLESMYTLAIQNAIVEEE